MMKEVWNGSGGRGGGAVISKTYNTFLAYPFTRKKIFFIPHHPSSSPHPVQSEPIIGVNFFLMEIEI